MKERLVQILTNSRIPEGRAEVIATDLVNALRCEQCAHYSVAPWGTFCRDKYAPTTDAQLCEAWIPRS